MNYISSFFSKPIDQVPIALQGEFAIVKGSAAKDTIVKTSIPTECNVFILHNKQSKVTVLAHLDDYTSVPAAIKKIGQSLLSKYNISMKDHSFSAKILGGGKDPFSKSQKEAILNAFREMKIPFEEVPLTANFRDRPQIAFNARNGDVLILEGDKINQRLEYLQQREYYEFDQILNENYGDLEGSQIPYFEIKGATRVENDIPEYQYKSIEDSEILEENHLITMPIQADRVVAKDQQELTAELDPQIEIEEERKTYCCPRFWLKA